MSGKLVCGDKPIEPKDSPLASANVEIKNSLLDTARLVLGGRSSLRLEETKPDGTTSTLGVDVFKEKLSISQSTAIGGSNILKFWNYDLKSGDELPGTTFTYTSSSFGNPELAHRPIQTASPKGGGDQVLKEIRESGQKCPALVTESKSEKKK